ncbi:MAG: glycosyltransferase family 2 protein [Vicinamibacteria bacterium]|nr:glycosyltransferase family 2 protein [Vicinamibacteria bacterium]
MTLAFELSVVVPCFNEEANLANLVARIHETMTMAGIKTEIVLVDDCSRDRTRPIIEELSGQHPFVLGVFHERNQGIAGGWRSGLAASHAPAIAIMDADLQYAPEDLPRLYRIWKREKPDVVQGWRIAHNFKATTRYLLSLGFSFLLNKLFGTRLRDIKSGFLCTSREIFKEMLETKHAYVFPQHFIVINAAARGYSIRQEPVLFWNREGGESFISSPFRFGLRSLVDLPHAFVEFRLNRKGRR